MRVFGTVPSRRLGRSLGINNIPPQICTYSCVYCQLGRSSQISTQRREFYNPLDLAQEVFTLANHLRERKEHIDYLTIVPDGEPTLDKNLGKILTLIKTIGLKTAVITNSSLLFIPEVREDLFLADLVSLKIDTVKERTWHRINRPSRDLDFNKVLEGITEFAKQYKGKLITETMLVKGFNDDEDNLCKTSVFIQQLNPETAYIAIPTRPPAESNIEKPTEETINKAYQIFSKHIENVELLIGFEGDKFASTGNLKEDILSITAVHPMTEKAVKQLLEKNNQSIELIEELINENQLKKVEYDGKIFYVRNLQKV